MQLQIIGLLITLFYVALSAGQGVFVGHFAQTMAPTTLCFYYFILVTIICWTLMLNLTTVGTWLGVLSSFNPAQCCGDCRPDAIY